MNISPEAREAAQAVLGQSAWDDVRQSHDSLSIVIAMQTLIDQTIERCAVVADLIDEEAEKKWKSGYDLHDQGRADGAYEAAVAIRSLKSNTDGGGDA